MKKLLALVVIIIISTGFSTGSSELKIRTVQQVRQEGCLCPDEWTPVGVVCSRGRVKFSLEPEGGCICGNDYLVYWICKKK